jgi:2-oxoglutarate dehydrogenase E2 component (dihydrolipoamide succinyltransferase)
MGESIAEGTIVRWIKKVGDHVDRDEPLFEISTDKVDAEIPSPVAGVLVEIRAHEGDTVPVNSVVAVVGDAMPAVVPVAAAPAPVAVPMPAAAPVAAPPAPPAPTGADAEDVKRQKSSPLVRKIAREHNVEIGQVAGTGLGGRVTKNDILGFIAGAPVAATPASSASTPTAHVPSYKPGDRVEVVPMSVMRKKIAEHMVFSRRTSAHVHSVFEVDYTRVAKIREAKKADYERAGAKLTFMSFLLKAVVDALKAVPIVNSSIEGENIVYRKDINLGVAVALDWGLIVPVIRQADEKSMLGLSRAVLDLATRARAKQLKPEDVQGGTFTITNPGVFGALFGMPIISQPQVAILGVGHIEKRVAVIDDAIAIRQKGYLSLGYDHRLIDGAVADQFMSHIKKSLEHFDPAAV